MRLDRFDLNLLVVLDTLLEERNVTRASERLHLGQSATSAALARLREYFDDPLLVPVGRQLRPTPLAESLVEPVRDTLLRARATIARKPRFDPATAQKQFTVCASDYVTTVMLAGAMRRIALEAPQVEIHVRGQSRDVFDVFDRGHIDLLVMPEQYMPRMKHMQSAWFTDAHVCMVCADHPLAAGPLSFEAYMALGHVSVRFGDERSITFEEWFLPRYGQQRRVEASVDNFSTLPLMVMGTQRIATLHRRLGAHFARHLPVRLLPAPFDMPPLVEMMCWPSHVDQDPAHQWLRSTLLAHAAAPA